MGLFANKKAELPPLISDEELFPSVNFESVMDWLVGLSATEYSQVLQVGGIQRKAKDECAKALGREFEVTTQINDPKDSLQTLEPVFLDDMELKPTKKKAKK